MICRFSVLALLLMFIPGILRAESHPVYENVSVKQVDGWQFNNVSAQLDDDESSLIIIRSDGASLNLSLLTISEVLNSEGIDITSEVVPDSLRRQDEFSVVSGNAHLYAPSGGFVPEPVHLFKAMFHIGAGYGAPVGDFYYKMDSNMIFLTDLRLAISPRTYLKFSYRNQKLKDATMVVYNPDNNGGSDGYYVSVDAVFTARQYLISVGFLNRPNSTNRIRGYGELGLGVVDHVVTVSSGSISESENEDRIMISGGAGFLVPFSKTIGMDCGFNALLKIDSNGPSEGSGLLFNAYLGLTISYGGGRD